MYDPDEPRISYTILTPRQARRRHHRRLAARSVVGAGVIVALIAPSEVDAAIDFAIFAAHHTVRHVVAAPVSLF